MPEPWTKSHRRAVLALILITLVVLSIKLFRNPAIVPDTLPESGPRADMLADRLDPNVAAAAQLAAIPTLGEKRAGEIVDYRGTYVKTHPGRRAFLRLGDLQAIKGIGPATAEAMEPYLVFPK